jgi:hypothetical protein
MGGALADREYQQAGNHVAPPEFIDENMALWEQNVLRRYPATKLSEDDDFCNAVAEIQGEFLVIHTSREGNARTIKLRTICWPHKPLGRF